MGDINQEYEDFISQADDAPDSTGIIDIITSNPQPSISVPATPFGTEGSSDDLSDIQP